MRYYLAIGITAACLLAGVENLAIAAEEKTEKTELTVSMEDNGFLNDAYSMFPRLFLTDIVEAALLERPEIISGAVKAARKSAKDIRVLRGELPDTELSPQQLEAEGKYLVGVSSWRPIASPRQHNKSYGRAPQMNLS